MPAKKQNKPPIFIGSAWPYVNASLHLGHVASFIGADFLARYYRLKGHPVLFVSGSDCHGTPIEVRAEQQNTTPLAISEKYHHEFLKNFKELGFSFDLYTKTHDNPNHYALVKKYFLDLKKKNFVFEKIQNLPYCETCNRFLPDRYVEGECPVCHYSPARGDQCDNCGTLLDAKDLINPRCKISGNPPIWKDSVHFFLKLTAFQKQLKAWVKKAKGWRLNAITFTTKFLEKGVIDRAITRDSDWGIPVPVKRFEKKTFYVWFEAVSGYLTASQEYSKNIQQRDHWKKFWQNKEAIHYYVHGKDNILFHSVIWPSILLGLSNLNLPDRIVSSEYFTFKGQQFSKSRGWGVWIPDFLKDYDPDTLRYYLGVNGPENADADFSWNEFGVKTNTELLGKFGNFINRVLNFIQNNFESVVPEHKSLDKFDNIELKNSKEIFSKVGKLIEETKFQAALKLIIKFAEECNRYIDQKEPWKTIKADKQSAANTLYVCVQAISVLQLLSAPFIPFTAEKIAKQLNVPARKEWKFFAIPAGHKINKPEPLFKKVELK